KMPTATDSSSGPMSFRGAEPASDWSGPLGQIAPPVLAVTCTPFDPRIVRSTLFAIVLVPVVVGVTVVTAWTKLLDCIDVTPVPSSWSTSVPNPRPPLFTTAVLSPARDGLGTVQEKGALCGSR